MIVSRLSELISINLFLHVLFISMICHEILLFFYEVRLQQ